MLASANLAEELTFLAIEFVPLPHFWKQANRPSYL